MVAHSSSSHLHHNRPQQHHRHDRVPTITTHRPTDRQTDRRTDTQRFVVPLSAAVDVHGGTKPVHSGGVVAAVVVGVVVVADGATVVAAVAVGVVDDDDDGVGADDGGGGGGGVYKYKLKMRSDLSEGLDRAGKPVEGRG